MLAQLPIIDQFSVHGLNDHDCPYSLAMGVILFQAVVFATASAYVAVHRGHRGLKWFLTGFFASALGFILALRLRDLPCRYAVPPFGKVPATTGGEPCPACRYDNHPAAVRCGRCGAPLTPKETDCETSRVLP